MRKLTIVGLGLAITAALAAPGQAAKPVRWRDVSASANAFWTDVEWLSATTYRATTWYIGAYRSTEGGWSDVYQDVSVCEVGGDEEYGDSCETESFLYGDRSVTADEFTVSRRLRSARLDATYTVQAYGSDYEPVGPSYEIDVTTEWTPVGKPGRGGGVWNFQDACFRSHSVSRDRYTTAEADGTVDGASLGETYDAWMSASSYVSIERTC